MALIAIDARFLHIGLSREKPFKGAIGGIGSVQMNQIQHLPQHKELAYLMLGDSKYPLDDLSTAIGLRNDIKYTSLPHAFYKSTILPKNISLIIERLQYADYFRRIRERHVIVIHTHGDLWNIETAQKSPFKSIVTLHDHLFCASGQKYRRPLTEVEKDPAAKAYIEKLRFASHVITVSDGIRNQLIEDFGFRPSQITTVYNGVDRVQFKRVQQNDAKYQKLVERFSIKKPFFVYFGSWHSKKNVQGIIASYESYRKRYSEDIQLLLGGNIAKFAPEMTRIIRTRIAESPFSEDILEIGYVNNEEISLLNSNARAFIHLSYYEGHCLGIAEAMSCGVPIVVSDGGAIDEEVGPHIPQFNPDNPDKVAEELYRLKTDDAYRATRLEAEEAAAERFSWEKSAADLAEVYMKVVSA